MLLTIKQLKDALNKLPPELDNVCLGSIDFADHEIKFFAPKRYLLIKDNVSNVYYLVMNNMGTHWSEKHEEVNNCKLIKEIQL